ncbi:CLUMA_CG016404, isoform A [Clunio marinus]|uniref:CLUMA_CG016404, isoform A n=1 Tax=Clunio marinus TaxID=568069 RepID=A0A1J1IU68_9DIPT|nr:CLUMA_CG016404, isoform A [Clunio marinus]
MYRITLFYFIYFIGHSLAQHPLPESGDCKDTCKSDLIVTPQEMTGIWHFTKGTNIFGSSKCLRLNITNVDDSTNNLEKSEIMLSTGRTAVTTGTMHYFVDIRMRFEMFSVSPDAFAMVLCLECGFYTKNGAGIYLEIFTRLPYPTCERLSELYSTMSSCGVAEDELTLMDQSTCDQSCN